MTTAVEGTSVGSLQIRTSDHGSTLIGGGSGPKSTRVIGFKVSREKGGEIHLTAGEGSLARSIRFHPDYLEGERTEEFPHGTLRVGRAASGEIHAVAKRRTGETATLVIANGTADPPAVTVVWGEAGAAPATTLRQDTLLGDHLVDRTCSEYLEGRLTGRAGFGKLAGWLVGVGSILVLLTALRHIF